MKNNLERFRQNVSNLKLYVKHNMIHAIFIIVMIVLSCTSMNFYSDNSKLQESLQESEQSIEYYKDENIRLSEQVSNLNDTISADDAEIEILRDRNKELSKENKKLEQANNKLKKSNSSSKNKSSAVQMKSANKVNAVTNGTTVHITKTGEKYHRSGCRYLRQSDITVSLNEAKSRGLTPCSVCNP